MKKRTIYMIFALGLFFIGSQNIFAQDIIDVPFGDNTLVDAVKNNPGKTLRLTGGKGENGEGLYIINEPVQDEAGGDIKIIGVSVDGLPPRIQNTINSSNGRSFKPLGDLYLENVMIMGKSLDGYDHYKGSILITKDSSNVTLKNVWFEYGDLIRNQGKDIHSLAEDCMFINIIDQEGLTLYQRVPIENGSFTYRNCSFVNSDGLLIYTKSAGAPHNFTVEHCTFYRILEGIMGGGQLTKNVNWKNNLFVDAAFAPYSIDSKSRKDEELPLAIFPIDTIGVELMQDRSFSINNNVFWRSPEVKTFYSTLTNYIASVPINATGQAVIDALPGCKYENNIEYTEDPNFVQGIPFTDASWDSAKARVQSNFTDNSIRTDWTWYVDDTPDIDWDYGVWPYPLNLKPQNENLWTAGDDGYPVGDLNWFPENVKSDWLANNPNPLTDIRENGGIIESYSLEQNYPNPFNPTTEITFAIPVAGNTNLAIYNVLGQKVITLVNKEMTAGSYTYQLNANSLSSGTYFYKLQSNGYTSVKKMILLK